jgi:hypothetical protein
LTVDKDYTAKAGSTVITLLPEYLDTLAAGSHTINVNFKDGSNVSRAFTVSAQTEQTQQTQPEQQPEEPQTQPPQQVTIGSSPFADVQQGTWYYSDVMYAYNNNLMAGTAADAFGPDLALTRGMVVTILYRVQNAVPAIEYDNPFSDVANGTWYADAVKWAAANDIVSGYGNGNFGPNDNITREQMATILNNYANFAGMNFRETRQIVIFDDSEVIAAYAKDAVDKFYRAGIISGKPGNLFDPKAGATRAEFASMLHRFLTS